MKALFLVLTFLFSLSASAAEVLCVAPFDEGSRYELRFSGENSPAALRYLTDDGLDLRAEMKVKSFRDDGNELAFEAANESMGVRLEAKGEGRSAKGILAVSFSLDEAEALELAAECRR